VRIALVNLTYGGFSGGYLKYLRCLIPRLSDHPHVRTLDVFVPETAREMLRSEPWPFRTFATRRFGGLVQLKQMVRSCQADLVFVPTASWLDFDGLPVLVMVRNMEPLEIPFGGNPLPVALKNLARRAMARKACGRARRIIAVSNHVRDFLTERWAIDPRKVGVVYHGLGADRKLPPVRPARLARIDAPFLFTAGSIRPARGLEDLVDAVGHLRAAGLDSFAVIAGGVDAGMDRYARSLEQRAERLGVADRIIRAGKLDAAGMRWCYEHATAFVMTSRAEACPNIALEAMSYGCVCVSVDRPPMPEFFGRSARYYRPGDTPELGRLLEALLGDQEGAGDLRTAAQERAAGFDWDDTARRTVRELQIALA
jgi:glycosyltransferase involved in cell wall biosynthesis